ncbi:PDZ domain-containing protein, partial [Longimicrobium sp.]|uniref:PDZ domain-containing protein n=1 Tax=Longimicrobium sp. TaxID=2029185 RepID=UPI002E329579
MINRYIGPALLVGALAWTSGADAQRCGNGGWRVGDLGFDGFRGSVSIEERDGRRPQYQFESEITIQDVKPDGPAANILRDGDVIAAIDGQLITTAGAGRRYSSLNPGDVVRLSVRRGGRMQEVTVRAGARCTSPPPAPPRPPRPPAAAPPP